MQHLNDLSGLTFGSWKVIDYAGRTSHSMWNCECTCGNRKTVSGSNLTSGKTTKCRSCYSHGLTNTPTYRSWNMMLQRCENPNNPAWDNYGGRGITVCDSWHKFANFLADMGIRPDDTSLDRIENDKGYEPGNCRWADRSTQRRNQRPRKYSLRTARHLDQEN